MAVGDAVYLHHRGEGAAAEARDLLHGEVAIGVGVVIGGDAQVPADRVVHPVGALDVAGRPVTDADEVLAHGVVAELCVEGRHALELRRGDLG